MRKFIVGIDLGGTKIATVLTDCTGKVLSRCELPTEASSGQDAVIQRIIKSVDEVTKEQQVPKDELLGMGIGSPGPLNHKAGIILEAPNLGWKNVPIRDILEGHFGVPVHLENDANAAALAEYRFGAGKGASNLLYMTVSTGVGGGIVINGRIYRGTHGTAGEIGHIIVEPNGPRCNCRNLGCLESMASGTGLVNRTVKEILDGTDTMLTSMVDGDLVRITAVTIAEAARLGDELSIRMYESVGEYLGIGIVSLFNVLDPEVIIIGGGMTKSSDLFADVMLRTIKTRGFETMVEYMKVVWAKLGDDVGTLGAVAVVMEAENL